MTRALIAKITRNRAILQGRRITRKFNRGSKIAYVVAGLAANMTNEQILASNTNIKGLPELNWLILCLVKSSVPTGVVSGKIKIQGNGEQIDLKKYSTNLCVGFEFEGNSFGINTLQEIAAHFNLTTTAKTGGKIKKLVPVRLYDGSEFQVPTEVDAYKEANLVTQVYRDGTVDTEVVTRPVLVGNIDDIKPVFDYVNSKINMKIPNAGLHMTFLTDKIAEVSNFDKIVVKNLMQLSRYYYSAIIYKFKTTTRALNYRQLVQYSEMTSVCSGHYACISTRRSNNKVWAVEIRFPDGNNDWSKIQEQVLFWSAMIRHAAKISQKGTIFIPQDRLDSQTRFYRQNSSDTRYSNPTVATDMDDLAARLKNEIDFFSKDDTGAIDELYDIDTPAAPTVEATPASTQ